ncbi:hypothetical protein JO83_09505 [Avibacterium paragallinarum]|nr:hypothetical protein JO83_09505 [Avibacterium paragallinarum]
MVFTEFPTIIPTPKEVNQRGIAYCRNVLGDKDPITKAFNRLSQPEKGCVIALAGTESGDLKTPYLSDLRLENYTNEGYRKIARAMWRIRTLANQLPDFSTLKTYTTQDQLMTREKYNATHN